MTEVTDLKDLFLAELQEARSVEDQLAETSRTLAGDASDDDLRALLLAGADAAGEHRGTLAQMLEAHGANPDAHSDETMRAMLTEARSWVERIGDRATRDAALIASIQRVQHYRLAVYGSLAAWAQALGLEDRHRLHAILDLVRSADETLSALAERRLNGQAAL